MLPYEEYETSSLILRDGQTEDVCEQGSEESIWSYESGGKRRMEIHAALFWNTE
jgi:hypothetical protein